MSDVSETSKETEHLDSARQLDSQDPLRSYRDQFHFPVTADGRTINYFVGNSLGLQPKRTVEYVQQELSKWQTAGIRSHFEGEHPWMPYHEFLTATMADLVGAKQNEVVMMNSLTANLHLMMATFYRPTALRHKVIIEKHSFPSDSQAVTSQIEWHGFDPDESLITLQPAAGSAEITLESIHQSIEEHGDSIAMIMLPGVQYYTGQVFPMQKIVQAAKAKGIVVGFDLAHAAGNVAVQLHDWDADFAVWCSYKYLNSGPGSVGGCFVHERHATEIETPRLAGWWGHDKDTRFQMKNEFRPIPTAEGWALSNPPILSLAAIRASLGVFAEAGGMNGLAEKTAKMNAYFRSELNRQLGDLVQVITPLCEEGLVGCQLSLQVNCGDVPGKQIHEKLEAAAVETDWREPDVIRVAPVPLYNSFEDCYQFASTLKGCL